MTVQEWTTNDKVIRHSRKAYAHFDYRTDISEKRAYITDPQKVAHHGFYPFIHYEMVMYRYRKGNRTKKTRDICYAALPGVPFFGFTVFARQFTKPWNYQQNPY